MGKDELSENEIKELDAFLFDGFNYDIYLELTDSNNEYFELFNPLEFFRLYHSQITFISENKNRPLFVGQTLAKLEFSEEQLDFLFDKLLDLIDNGANQKDKQLQICRNEIAKSQANLSFYENIVEENENKHKDFLSRDETKFQDLLKLLETLPTEKAKIKHLEKEKILLESEKSQESLLIDQILEHSFYNRLTNELHKRERLLKLEENYQNISIPKIENEQKPLNKHQDLTLDKAVLAMNYLFTHLKVNCHNTKKSQFISFLTGYSEKQITQKFSALHKNADDNRIKYEKDMTNIKQYFTELGLIEIADLIDKDLSI